MSAFCKLYPAEKESVTHADAKLYKSRHMCLSRACTAKTEVGRTSASRVCETLRLAALCQVLHVFSNVVHVGDVRPLLRVRVDAHIYQVPQLL